MFILDTKRNELMVNGLLIYSDNPEDEVERKNLLKRIIESIEPDKKIIVYSNLELFLRMLNSNKTFDELINYLMNFKTNDFETRHLIKLILDTSKQINYRAKFFYECYYAKLNGYIINFDNELELKSLLEMLKEYYDHGIGLDDIEYFANLINMDYDIVKRNFGHSKNKFMTA